MPSALAQRVVAMPSKAFAAVKVLSSTEEAVAGLPWESRVSAASALRASAMGAAMTRAAAAAIPASLAGFFMCSPFVGRVVNRQSVCLSNSSRRVQQCQYLRASRSAPPARLGYRHQSIPLGRDWMSFKADQQAIRGFGGQIDSLTDDADAAVSYVRNHLGIGYDKGRMFFTVVESATTVRDALMANYKQLSKLATESA